jgi:hypothetical protein
MADLVDNQIPKYFNTIYKKVGKLPNSQGAGALGSDTNGILIHTFTKDGYVGVIKISSKDEANNGVFLYVKDGSTIIPEGSVSVPLNSGNTAGVAVVDGLYGIGVASKGDWVTQSGKYVIPVAAGQDFKCSAITALDSDDEIYVTCAIFEKE